MLRGRVERDLFASSFEESYTPRYGLPPYTSSLSTVFGLYYPAAGAIGDVIMIAAAQQAAGLFILPQTEVPGRVFSFQNAEASYWSQLRRWGLLTFRLPQRCLVSSTTGALLPDDQQPLDPLMGIFASFNFAGRFKSKRRPEREFRLERLPQVWDSRPKIEVTPFCHTRASPLTVNNSGFEASFRRYDLQAASPAWSSCSLLEPAPPPPALYRVPMFTDIAAQYPCAVVARLAIETITSGVNGRFAGDLSKAVERTNPPFEPTTLIKVRARLEEEVAKGHMAGPFPRPPFPSPSCPYQPRICPIHAVPKKKYDPANDDIRLICNFSSTPLSGAVGSVNSLCWSPKLISFHPRPFWIREELAHCGPSAGVMGMDVPSCFRRHAIDPQLRSLFVYYVEEPDGSRTYYVDLRTPFGWVPSEWAWQCVLALIKWYGRLYGLGLVLAYVDNFFVIRRSRAIALADGARLRGSLAAMGIDVHEVQDSGTAFNGLGWDWEHRTNRGDGQEGWVMMCPTNKYVCYFGLLKEVTRPSVRALSLEAIQRLCGVMQFIGEGWPWALVGMAPLWELRTDGQARIADRRLPSSANRGIMLMLNEKVLSLLGFWKDAFEEWGSDPYLPVLSSFGPHASWQCLIRTDASREGYGCLLAVGNPVDSAEDAESEPVRLLGIYGPWSPETLAEAFVESDISTGYLEALAIREAFREWHHLLQFQRVQLEGDNRQVVRSIESGFTPVPKIQPLIRDVWSLLVSRHIHLRPRHVKGATFNRIADALSHLDPVQAQVYALEEFGASRCPIQFSAATPSEL